MRTSFYTYFSSCYGTLWLISFVWAFVGRVHIELGWIALYGFPAAGLAYAGFRRAADTGKLKAAAQQAGLTQPEISKQ